MRCSFLSLFALATLGLCAAAEDVSVTVSKQSGGNVDGGDSAGDDSADALAAGQDMLATTSLTTFRKQCMYKGRQHLTVRHPTDPRRYQCGGHWLWFKRPAGVPSYPHRCGKWYKSDRSNEYYAGGAWKTEPVALHPSDPTLVRMACRWVKRTATPESRLYYKSKSGIWYKNRSSREYYAGGKWGNFEIKKPHPTDPNLVLRAGRWVRATGLRGQKRWAKRCGAWWRAPPNLGLESYQFYKAGHWKTAPGYWKYRNNPMFLFDSRCRFVKRKPTAATKLYRRFGTSVFRKGALPGGGFWFKRPGSLSYYKDGVWRLASRHLQDPRWRRDDRTGSWRVLSPVTNPQVRQYTFDATRRVWWQTKAKLRYWWYGRWKVSKAHAAGIAKRRAWMRRRNEVADRVTPIDLHGVVRTATDREFARFMRWFTTKVVAETREVGAPKVGASKAELARMDGHGPRRLPSSPENPEPGVSSKRNLFDPEPPKGRRQLFLERIRRTPVVRAEETGAKEPFWADKGHSPDSKIPSYTDSVRYGHLTWTPEPSKTGPGMDINADNKVARL